MTINRRWVIRWACCSVLVCALWPWSSQAQTELLINFDAANPPFMYGSSNQAEGLYPELIGAVFHQMGRPVSLAAKPWKRALGELDLGIAGVGGIYKTEDRLKKYDFSEPLFVERIVVYYNHDKAVNYRMLSDLYGKRVGILLGWSYGDKFDNARKAGKIIVEEVYADTQNFDKLVQGRVDAVLAIEQVGSSLMREPRNASVGKSLVFLAENPTHLAFNKQMHVEALLSAFNRALNEIKKNGTYTQIVDKMATASKPEPSNKPK